MSLRWSIFTLTYTSLAAPLPRSSTIEWRYPGAGGVYATSWDHFLPFLRK